MSKYIDILLQAIPESDPNYHTKRAEIRRWYDVYGEDKILYGKKKDDFDSIMKFLLSSLEEEKFWNGGGQLNSSLFVKFLLSKRDEVPLEGFGLYNVACLICSEEDVRSIFSCLDVEPVDEFLSEYFENYPGVEKRLMEFWSHYVSVIGVENPNPVILNSFRKLLSLYDASFRVDNSSDIWKCGFECAKQEGCKEALDFFWSKLSVE